MINWKLETRPISSLIPHAKNPRKLSKHDAEHLQQSIEKFGLIDKPLISIEGKIIGGHQRIALLKKMGVKDVDCWIPDRPLEDKEIDELCIKMNRVHGEFDYDLLANAFDQEDLLQWGFTESDLGLDVPFEEIDAVPKKEKKKTSCPQCGHEF